VEGDVGDPALWRDEVGVVAARNLAQRAAATGDGQDERAVRIGRALGVLDDEVSDEADRLGGEIEPLPGNGAEIGREL